MKRMVTMVIWICMMLTTVGCKSEVEKIEEEKSTIREAAPEIDEEGYSKLIEEFKDIDIDVDSKDAYNDIDTEILDSYPVNKGFLPKSEFEELVSGTMSQKDIWNTMHVMANTKIEAKHVWGKVEITDELVDFLIIKVINSNYVDKKKLLHILERWKNNDFSEAVSDHNYLWSNLDGTIGKAFDLNDEVKKMLEEDSVDE